MKTVLEKKKRENSHWKQDEESWKRWIEIIQWEKTAGEYEIQGELLKYEEHQL